MHIKASAPAIAVIGMGCWYPGARGLQQLWENILARRQQFRRSPNQRLPLSSYYDPDSSVPDKTYGTQMAVIDGFEFDWASKRIPKTVVESADIAHWVALEVALKAVEDARYTRDSIPTERTGVLVGNSLTGEQTRSNNMRLRWPFVQRALHAAAQAKSLPLQTVAELAELMEQYYKSVFAPFTEDTLPGNLSNTIAGRICNFFNFHGGGYTVDGACASSLIAVATAATALNNGDLDLALAGGVDISLDSFELVGFAKTGALTRQDMTVYDQKASGFIPGEGCGFVVLKRLEDARADNNYVYAVLNGWGISSDGKGSLTAPNREGQVTALRRAYDRASYKLRDVAFIEGHGTGTPLGDQTELEAIALAMESDSEINPTCGVTSIKSLVGHTKAAAGVGGLIKAVMAVNRRIIPPLAGCKQPNAAFKNSAHCLYPVLQGEVRSQTELLRAGVSAMGFGGINCHLTLESGDAPAAHLQPSIEERVLLVSDQETEIFVLSATSVPALLQHILSAIGMAEGLSLCELIDLAAHLALQLQPQLPVRAAIVAGSASELVERLNLLEKLLSETPPAAGKVVVIPQKGVWVGNAVQQSRVGFLFPRQGSEQLNMARALVERYNWARELMNQADDWLREVGAEGVSEFIYRPLDRAAANQVEEWSRTLARTEIAQPAICLASLLWIRYLNRLGVKPVAAASHSFDEKALLCLAAVPASATPIDVSLIKTLAQTCDLLLEVGPGTVLSQLANDITAPNGPPCLPIESKPGFDRDLNAILATVFVRGSEINWEALYEGRLVRSFVPASERIFIENPCERLFQVSKAIPPWGQRFAIASPALEGSVNSMPHNNAGAMQKLSVPNAPTPAVVKDVQTDAIEVLIAELIVQQTKYARESITMEMRLLDDLNLDSIKAGEVIATAARQCGLAGKIDPLSLANATIQEIAAAFSTVIANSNAGIAN